MPAFKSRVCFVVLLALLALGACGEPGFTAKFAPGYSPAGKHISVFGIKRDGLMNRAGWAALGPNLSPAFNGNSCEVAYGETMFSAVPALAAEVDDYTRANGVSDDLLAELAPIAKGDTIMLLTIAGHPLLPPADLGSAVQGAKPASSSSAHSRKRGGAANPANSDKASSAHHDPFDVSATFYSIADHRSVAFLELSYDGSKIEEALSEFRNRLEEKFPGSTCSGWDWNVHVDEAKIHELSLQ
jgi:hypothetical protein